MQRSLPDARRLAEAVRAGCIQAALDGYEDAARSGLCDEGALEAAVSAMRMIDIDMLIESASPP